MQELAKAGNFEGDKGLKNQSFSLHFSRKHHCLIFFNQFTGLIKNRILTVDRSVQFSVKTKNQANIFQANLNFSSFRDSTFYKCMLLYVVFAIERVWFSTSIIAEFSLTSLAELNAARIISNLGTDFTDFSSLKY